MPPRKTAAKTAAQPTAKQANGKPPAANAGIDERIAWVQSQVAPVDKTGEVAFGKTRYDYMQEHGLLGVLKALLAEAQLSYTGTLAADLGGDICAVKAGNHAQVIWRLDVRHKDELRSGYTVAEGVDPADKAFPKAMTMANKYALQKFFQVPTEQIDDADAHASSELAAKSQASSQPKAASARKLKALRETAADASKAGHIAQQRIIANLQSSFGVERIDELDDRQADAFATWLEDELKKSAAS